jgi:hypothetical protein
MMPIDPSIAMGVRPLEVPNQLAQYGQLAQIQNAQNQNALAQFQLASAQRGEEQQSNFYREAQRPGFTLDAATAMRYGAPGMAALKAQQEAQKQELERQKLTGEIKKQASDEIDSSLSVFKKAIPGIRTPQQVERYVREQYRHPVVGKIAGMFMSEDEAVADALTQASTPDGLNTWKLDNIGLTGAQLLDMMKQTTDKTDLGGTSSAQTRDWKGAPVGAPVSTPKTVTPGEASTAATALAGQRITARGQDIVAGTAAKALAQAGNLPLQESLAAARERGTLTTKNEVAAKAILPKVIADAEVGLAAIDGMIGSAQVDKKSGEVTFAQGGAEMHPGFGQSVGVGVPGLKYVHGTAEADFDALYKQVMGGAFLDAYESLRGANAITDIEGAKGTAAKTRLSTAQSEVEFVRAARELQSIMRKGVERAKAKAKAGAAPAAVPAAGEWGKAVAE